MHEEIRDGALWRVAHVFPLSPACTLLGYYFITDNLQVTGLRLPCHPRKRGAQRCACGHLPAPNARTEEHSLRLRMRVLQNTMVPGPCITYDSCCEYYLNREGAYNHDSSFSHDVSSCSLLTLVNLLSQVLLFVDSFVFYRCV
jgi:hypothetical protein